MSTKLKPFKVLAKVGNAVRALGETEDIVMHNFVPGDTRRIKVNVDEKYLGIYDTVRDTFVD